MAIYEWWNGLQIGKSIRVYLLSLGAILFQYNVLSGIILAMGLLYFSRISFTLSLVGFYTAYLFYEIIGADISELSYSYIGFNYILTSIAIGGFFIIPSKRSFLWVLVLIPLVAMVTISMTRIFTLFGLPIYSLPFNVIVLLFLYALKFRTKFSRTLSEVYIQQNSPERNLYSFQNDMTRFRHAEKVPVTLPFYGSWSIAQAHDGEHTHKDEFRHAWDFVITDSEEKQFTGTGDNLEDYYCYDKQVLAPAEGTIELIVDNISDNPVGDVDTKNNWGNTIIIRHAETLFTSMSHLKPGSITVKTGERVKEGDSIARCGNSGRSPYPHLHFQFQATPYIGSVTLDYPFSHYILNSENHFNLQSFEYPKLDQKVSNIEKHQLLEQAMHLIPGKKMSFDIINNGHSGREQWEVLTDPYNNSYISCHSSQSRAWFTSDGNLLFFTHFQGDKKSLLYYFFLAAYKVQSGFYQDLVLKDNYPLNLTFRQPLLSLQDFLAPFWKFFGSEYEMNYAWIDNEIMATEIRLESSATNVLFGFVLKRLDFIISVGEMGIRQIEINGEKFNIRAKCTDCQ